MSKFNEMNDDEIVNEYYGTIEAIKINNELGVQDYSDSAEYLEELREEIRKRDLYCLFTPKERRRIQV